jgi:integrase
MGAMEAAARERRVRALHRLSAVKVAKMKTTGLYEDGGGLRLIVTDKGVKRWALRVTISGRRVERGLGIWPAVSLEDARRAADRFRRAARDGRDARLDEKHESGRRAVLFKDAFEAFFELRRQQLSNGKHIQQWWNTMRDYVFPVIGDRPVANITAAEVIEVLKPIWFSKPQTAARVLQRMNAVFDSAILRGTRERANPCIGVTRELGTDHRKVSHHPALAWQEVPAFVRSLQTPATSPAMRLLFEFLILTAARSGEARGALWSEIDPDQRTWTIPGLTLLEGAQRQDEPTWCQLSRRALEILAEARRLHDGPLVFPGRRGQPFSDNTLSKLMRDAGTAGTPHGFRSAFKDWAAEQGIRDEISEAALGHADGNKVRAAYLRTQFLDERRAVMERWARMVTGASPTGFDVSPHTVR